MSSGDETTRRSQAEPPAPASATAGAAAGEASLLGLLGRGDRLGRYLVLERIGHGGMGSVYLALDASLERKVAIKVLHPGVVAAADERTQLIAEAKAMALLAHPNVVTVHEASIDRGRVFLAMEYVPGRNVRAWLTDGSRSWRNIAEVFRQAALGLAAAHCAGLVHRDVKPDNILVGNDERVRLTDFGVAIDLFTATSDRSSDSTIDDDDRDAARSGTPAYMSPEQHAGGAIDARSDQFSFGVAMYEALFGQRPFVGRSVRELRQAHRRPFSPPVGTTVPPWLTEIVLRMLAIDPSARWPDVDEVAAALTRGLMPKPRRLRRAAALAAIPLAGLGLTLGGRLAVQPDACAEASAIDDVWHDTRRDEVVASLSAEAFSVAVAPGVAGSLDAYADTWSKQFREACERHEGGVESDALFDRRQVCLHSRRRAMAALVDVLAAADSDVRRNAMAAVTALPRVRDCEAARMVDEHAWVVPTDSQAREAYDAVEDRLLRAQALYDAGRLRDGDGELPATMEAARALGDERITIGALLLVGAYDQRLDRPEAAATMSDEAWRTALRVGDSAAAVRAAILYAESEGYARWRQPGTRDRAMLRTSDAEALVDRVGLVDHELAIELRARLSMARARVMLRYDPVAAREISRSALAEFRRLPDRAPLELARYLSSVATMESAAGDHPAALELNEQVLDIYLDALGPEHPDAGAVHNNLGLALRSAGEYTAAVAHFERAADIGVRAFGEHHTSVRTARTNLAIAHHRARDHARAVEAYARLLPELDADIDWSTVTRAHEYASSLAAVGRADDAVSTLREGIARGRTVVGTGSSGDSQLLADALSNAEASLAALLAPRGAAANDAATIDPHPP